MNNCCGISVREVTQFLICLLVLSFGAQGQNSDELLLPETEIVMPWETYMDLSTEKSDTVYIEKNQSALPIVFENARFSFVLSDSAVDCNLNLDYYVLDSSAWSNGRVFGPEKETRFSSIRCHNGDHIRSTDSGYVLLARRGKQKRHISFEWQCAAGSENGTRSVHFPIPSVSQGDIVVRSPAAFSEISVNGSEPVKRSRSGLRQITTFALPQSTQGLLKFIPPLKDQEENESSADAGKTDRKTPKIFSDQETVVLIRDGAVLSFTNLTLEVVNTAVREFSVRIPQTYSLLSLNGNGLKKWRHKEEDLITVELNFELEGKYSALFVMEADADSVETVPWIYPDSVSRRTGRFAVALADNGEPKFRRMHNCEEISVGSFLKNMDSRLSQLVAKQNIRKEDYLLAGKFHSFPFEAQFSLRYYERFPVIEAVADSGTVVSAISDDWKMVTQVTYWIRQKNKQFVSLSLPDTCDIWNVYVNGMERTPFVDDSGRIRILLQQNRVEGTGLDFQEIKLVYFQQLAETGEEMSLRSPIPDVPVNSLSWLIYYPGEWHLSAGGDFTTSRGRFIPRTVQLDKSESGGRYTALQKVNGARLGLGGEAGLVLPESPRHVYGRRILVVNEDPVMELRFGTGKWTYVWWGGVFLVMGGVVFVVMKIRSKGERVCPGDGK